MAMSKSSYNYNRRTWEDSEFPILCQTCLGPNPYVRMLKDKYGEECKICQRPFTSFRWMPGKGARYKKTEVCQTCAKLKNVCQTCLLDLEYGLPVQVRDHALQIADDLPRHGANKDFYVQNAEKELARGDGTTPGGTLAKLPDQGPNEILKKLARTTPYYHRNLPHICSFWVKGECKRGEECPFRHVKPSDPDDPLSNQKLRERYYGTEDPVADKMLNRAKALPQLNPPEDKSITTLYVGNLGDAGLIGERELHSYFYQFGEIRNIHVLGNKGCAFVQFTTRVGAEMAAEKAFNKLVLKQRRLTIRWGRPHAQFATAPGETKPLDAVPGLPAPLPTPDFFGLESGGDDGPSTKKARTNPSANIPLPPAAPPVDNPGKLSDAPPRQLAVPRVPPPGHYRMPPPPTGPMGMPGPSGLGGGPPRAPPRGPPPKIYYPSQDPQRLGAKGDIVE